METASDVNEFVVLQPGPLTTIQDMGRPGWGAYGVPEGGALDRRSMQRANALVGNLARAPGLEFSYRGPALRWRGRRPVTCAVVGDEESVRIVHPGEEMYAGFLAGRAHGYVAVPGGFAVDRMLGGRGTCLIGGFGGHLGRGLLAGDVLALEPGGRRAAGARLAVNVEEPAIFSLEVMPFGGSRSAAQAFRGLTRATWQVQTGDRVGVNLTGPELRLPGLGLSQPACAGAIQVSGAGRPILLLRDHPTVGGYPLVAVVVQADLDRAAWLRPGQEVRFVATTEAGALARLRPATRR